MDKSCQCDKTCSHQSNITHHSRTCKSIRKKKVCKCKKCSKTFFCNFHLQAHLKNHLKKCDICNQQSRKVDLLNEHRLQCAGVNDEQFETYFTFSHNYQSVDVIDEFTLMSIQENDQFVPSGFLLLDSSLSIDVNNEIHFDAPSFAADEPNTQSVLSSVNYLASNDDIYSSDLTGNQCTSQFEPNSTNRSPYWKSKKKIKRKSKNLEEIIQLPSSSPLKKSDNLECSAKPPNVN